VHDCRWYECSTPPGRLTADWIRGRRIPLHRSLTFATHFFTFTLLWLSVLFPALGLSLHLAAAGGLRGPIHHNFDLAVTAVEAAVIAWYL